MATLVVLRSSPQEVVSWGVKMTKLKDINWNQVYYFYEVARKLSMKEAAEVTGVSIPTVSEQIKRLEILLETPLFHRRPRRIELTEQGEILYHHAQQMFASGLRFLDVVSPTTIGGYSVRIGMQESYTSRAAMDFMMKYFDAYSPFGTVNTLREPSPEHLIEEISSEHLDWGIVQDVPARSRLESAKIITTEIVFCASGELMDRCKDRVELFQGVPMARSRFDEQINRLVTDHLQAADIFVEESIESDHLDFVMNLASQGKCVVPIVKNLQHPGLQNGQLRTFGFGGPILLSLYALWRKASERMIAIRKLLELLEVDARAGLRSRPPVHPTPPLSNEPAPIELPHFFDALGLPEEEGW